MQSKKVVLKENVLNHIHSYMKNILQPILEGLHKTLNNIDVLRNIPLVDCDTFKKICKEEIEDEDLIDHLTTVNAILKSENLDSLDTCELYHDILNGTIYPKPTTTLGSLILVDEIRKIALNDYQEIIRSFDIPCLGDVAENNQTQSQFME